jgi:hypothetical protein
MAAVELYLDEDVHAFIAHALRLRGWDVLTTQEAQRREADDLDQVNFATSRGRAIVSYNVRDFARLHYELLRSGEAHAGIIVATQDDPRRNLRALFNLLNAVSGKAIRGQLLYLGNWA